MSYMRARDLHCAGYAAVLASTREDFQAEMNITNLQLTKLSLLTNKEEIYVMRRTTGMQHPTVTVDGAELLEMSVFLYLQSIISNTDSFNPELNSR